MTPPPAHQTTKHGTIFVTYESLEGQKTAPSTVPGQCKGQKIFPTLLAQVCLSFQQGDARDRHLLVMAG